MIDRITARAHMDVSIIEASPRSSITAHGSANGGTNGAARLPPVPTIEHADALEDLTEVPRYVMPEHEAGIPQNGKLSCSYCGVGDGATADRVPESPAPPDAILAPGMTGKLWVDVDAQLRVFEAATLEGALLRVSTTTALVAPGAIVRGDLEVGGARAPFVGREIERVRADDGSIVAHVFRRFTGALTAYREVVRDVGPTTGCIKLRHSKMRQRAAYPIHTAPSVLDHATGLRRAITYEEAIARLADLMLEHRQANTRTLLYASGQVDYFAIFATQEVFRLLGIRNLTGNAEHCLNAGAVHNEMLTGQEGPFLTIKEATTGPNRFYVFNGWNGYVSHPPVFKALLARPDLDAYLVEVMVTESAKALAESLGKDRVLLIRPRSDPHFALSVAHEILTRYPNAVSRRFIERFSDVAAFEAYEKLARSEAYSPDRVAERIAPEPEYVERLRNGIQRIALKIAQEGVVPINIPSVGLSQTSGAVAHCLWGSVLGLVGKYGLNSDSTAAGGTLRLPGQINAESEVQGLSRKYFMGRVPIANAADVARRMGLPDDAYDAVRRDPGRAALDYSDPTPGTRELFVCMGTQFEANMMGRPRWIQKLKDPTSTLVVIDPIPDPFSEAHADLIIPSPPHPATTKLYQNGEWKFTLSVPQKRAAPETRSDATIVYDLMAEITRRLDTEPALAAIHHDLVVHARSGYLARRFCPPEVGGGLTRIDGEVSRSELWTRIQEYMSGGSGPLYCRPEHADGRLIAWTELVERGSVYYGGVGVHRYKLDYEDPEACPYRDVWRRPAKFKFFHPTDRDLEIPSGVIFNSGRSTLSDERPRITFAIATFNSGKATPIVGMPDDNPLFISPAFAKRSGITSGSRVRLRHPTNGASVELFAQISDRVKGELVYASFHKSRAQMERNVYVNDVTSHEERCPYTSQSSFKASRVALERVEADVGVETRAAAAHRADGAEKKTLPKINTTLIDPMIDVPLWPGRDSPLYVTDIIEDTHDVYTFRLQGDPLCRFRYWPGQFATIFVEIDGKRVARSYSISSTPSRPYVLELTIKRVPGGLVSNWLPDHLKIGDQLDITGPKGKFCLTPGRIPKKILFLGAGSGITPLMSMARWLCDVSADVDIKFFNSVKTPKDIVFHRELEMLSSRHRGFEPIVITSSRGGGGHGWTGLSGRISRSMLEMVAPDLSERHVYMCGPEGFMTRARELLVEVGFDLANLHAESFAPARTTPAEPAPAGDITVEFARAGRRVSATKSLPVLDLAESNGIEIEYGCRTGNCGDCKVRVLRGEVNPVSHEGLDEDLRKAGWVLSCVAMPRTDCVIDA